MHIDLQTTVKAYVLYYSEMTAFKIVLRFRLVHFVQLPMGDCKLNFILLSRLQILENKINPHDGLPQN